MCLCVKQVCVWIVFRFLVIVSADFFVIVDWGSDFSIFINSVYFLAATRFVFLSSHKPSFLMLLFNWEIS